MKWFAFRDFYFKQLPGNLETMTFCDKLEVKSTTLVSVIFNSFEEEILMSNKYGDKGFLNLISKLGGGVRRSGSFNPCRVPTCSTSNSLIFNLA